MRELVVVPMLHEPHEMVGNYSVSESYLRILSRYWDRIDAWLAPQKFDRIYPEGYLRNRGSGRMWQSIKRHDAPLVCIEDERLHEAHRRALGTVFSSVYLRLRDEHAARCIDTTLCEGERGLLYMGALHSVEKFLDVRVSYPPASQRLSEFF